MIRSRAICATLALTSVALLGATGCGPRQVDVRTAPEGASAATLQVNNTLTQGVNVYVTQNGADTFLRQVGAKSSATIPVQGFAAGTRVSLKAVTLDGVRTFTRSDVTLNGTYVFPLP